ncbi:coth protein-domain-containing protein [Radiomyces spectabilis]|uniref:coth protein-domain-containing protein n=1 Tax=Radiomyces spectabilis TaxID=64574 RepID=UPI002220EDE1|nr:coth protein-domain-containing protein [Radiomyces spectabilis]KAI8380988.1 coth protein-domain-containing protein [Radiomyces spectabilis]
MKVWAITFSIATLVGGLANAADVQYSVVAFPKQSQGVAVSVGGQNHPLSADQNVPNLFKGKAPSGDSYQYVITEGQQSTAESVQRKLAQSATSTGNEFFNRSQTVFDVPSLPQAYNPVYTPLYTNMNRSNEIATIVMKADGAALEAILKDPLGGAKAAEVYSMAYISSEEVHTFKGASIKNSGQSTKDYAKQSYKIEFNKFNNATKGNKEHLYGRSVVKLRSLPTDPTFVREKLMLDILGASGAATLSGSWARLYVNDEPYGLFLMIDDASTRFINAALHGGNNDYPYTGATYKGNALSDDKEANLVYKGDDPTVYPKDVYKMEDTGETEYKKKNNTLTPLIKFMSDLQHVQIAQDDKNQGNISKLLDPDHTLIQLAVSFLSGSWDGVWAQASNYYLNQDLSSQKWTLITYDFDEALGNGAPENLFNVTYQDFTPQGAKRPMIEPFIKSPYYSKQFEETVKTLVKRFFKPSVIEPRLEAWHKMLREDIIWDRALPARSPGQPVNWTVDDFDKNLNTTVQGNLGIAEWIRKRTDSVKQQLSFTEEDDLPGLPKYTGGRVMDKDGNVHSMNKNQNQNQDGGNTNNGNNGDNTSGETGDKASNAGVAAFTPVSMAVGMTVAAGLCAMQWVL